MLTVSEHSTLTAVYTAEATGVYTFAISTTVTNGHGDWRVESRKVGETSDGPSGSFSAYMEYGDVLYHQGSECQLAGYRIGNEFEDP